VIISLPTGVDTVIPPELVAIAFFLFGCSLLGLLYLGLGLSLSFRQFRTVVFSVFRVLKSWEDYTLFLPKAF